MKRTIAIALVLSFCLISPAFAANWYVRPSGGTGSGTSWTAAWNGFGAINWSSVQPGDTVWVAGGAYGDLKPYKSGTSGNPISIRRARSDSTSCTGASGWSSGYDSNIIQSQTGSSGGSIVLGSFNYLTFSGATTAAGGTQGWVISRPSSTETLGIQVYNGSVTHHVTFEYIEVAGPGRYNAWYYDSSIGSAGVSLRPFTTGSGYYTLSHLKVHGWADPFFVFGLDNVIIEYCDIYWAGSGSATHPDIMYIKHSNNGIIRYNTIHDNSASGTGIAFSDGGPYENWKIYGNVFYDNDTSTGYAIALQSGAGTPGAMNGLEIYNNVFDNSSIRLSGMWCGTGCYLKNNVFIGNSGTINCGIQSNNITVNDSAFVNRAARNYRPVSTIGSGYMRNAGLALTGDGYTNKDMDGNTRGQGGAWSAGAFEYAGDAIPSNNTINAPTGVKILTTQ